MLNLLLIIILQLVYVPIYTLRTIFLVKNITILASILGIAENLIYVLGLSLVFGGNKSILAMVVYSVGFGLGVILGTKLEQKLAIGFVNVVINTQEKNEELINELRNNGFGITLYSGEGKDGERYQMDILSKRTREKELIKIVERFEPKAFIITYEPKRFKGGFLLEKIK